MYVASPEVNSEILEHSNNKDGNINGFDVVSWCLEQSVQAIENGQPLRVLQGISHAQRRATMETFYAKHGDKGDMEVNVASPEVMAFREKEGR